MSNRGVSQRDLGIGRSERARLKSALAQIGAVIVILLCMGYALSHITG